MARRIHSNDDDDDDGHPHASGSGSGGGSGSGQYHNEGSQSSVNGRRKRQKQTLETIFAKQDIAEKRAISVKLRELQSQAEGRLPSLTVAKRASELTSHLAQRTGRTSRMSLLTILGES